MRTRTHCDPGILKTHRGPARGKQQADTDAPQDKDTLTTGSSRSADSVSNGGDRWYISEVEKIIGNPVVTAAQATGVAGHVMEAENVAPDKGKQDLPPEGTQTQKPVALDLHKAAMPAERAAGGGEATRGTCADTAEARAARAQALPR